MAESPLKTSRTPPAGTIAEPKMPAILQNTHPFVWFIAVILVFMPTVASSFVLTQIFAWSFILGMIALSLMFLAGYGGMVSLAQMSFGGLAGYILAILGTSGMEISLGWPWYVAVPIGILFAVLLATITGMLAVRTQGIYTIMITLAIAAAFFYFTRQNYVIFNGFSGFNLVIPPTVLGVNWGDPAAFYYLCLFFATISYGLVIYISRSTFGLALQGIRDNPRRMSALGYHVNAHRVAAYAFSALIAGMGGILLVWLNGQISPNTASVAAAIDILVIAVIGGLGRPIGPFIGALIYVILKTFALDILEAVGLSGERFRLLIGLGFLAIVFTSPDGVLGLWERWRVRLVNNIKRLSDS